MTVLSPAQKEHLALHGYAVVKGLVEPELCCGARAMIDAILGAKAKQVAQVDLKIDYDPLSAAAVDADLKSPVPGQRTSAGATAPAVRNRAGEDNRWPESVHDPPYITSGNFTHSILHPINDPAAALLVPPMVPLQADLLRCRTEDVKLLNQNFRRTDRSPPPQAQGAAVKQAWHMDSAFLPRHYETEPRQNYYISLLALSPVEHGVAPFCMVPGSLQAALTAGRALPADEAAAVDGMDCRTKLPGRLRELGVQDHIDADPAGREVYLEEGDMLLLDPMTTHGGSPCHLADARYVLFSTFFSPASVGETLVGLKQREYTAPAWKYPAAFRKALPSSLAASLLDWQLPLRDPTTDGQSYLRVDPPSLVSPVTPHMGAKL